MPEPLLHITPREEWEAAQAAGEYRSPTLGPEGFIHCSTSAQLARTADRHFTGRSGLVVLAIDEDRLRVPVRWEGEPERFPHVYGPVNLDAITRVVDLPAGPDGFAVPAGLAPEAPAVTRPEPPAAPAGSRLAAGLMDLVIYLLIVLPLLMLVVVATHLVVGNGNPDLEDGISATSLVVLLLVVRWLYLAACDASRLRGSLGKIALGLAVTRVDGSRVGFGRASLREWTKLITYLPTAGIAVLVPVLVTRRGQGPHDLLAGTVVVRREAAGPAPALAVTAGPAAAAAAPPPSDPRPASAVGGLLVGPQDLPRPLRGSAATAGLELAPVVDQASVIYRDRELIVQSAVAIAETPTAAEAAFEGWSEAGALGAARELHSGPWGDRRLLRRWSSPAGDRYLWICRDHRVTVRLEVSGPAEGATLLEALRLIGIQQRRITSFLASSPG